jgi:CRP-like cAMP-binding protein
VESDAELDAVLDRIKMRTSASRGQAIVGSDASPKHTSLLLDGIACSYERLEDGARQIHAFLYAGDFCDLYRQSSNVGTIAAVTACSIGVIEHKDLEHLITQYPALRSALWRSTMMEASISRQRLLNKVRQSALQRVAHLLCEQMARRELVGIDRATIPLTQMDLADAAGLSIVHINRTFHKLLSLRILAKVGVAIEVVNKERLVSLANFDGRYLNMPQLLSHWQINTEDD